MAMTNENLVKIVQNEFKNSMGVPGGDISTEREQAWRRYKRKMLGNEPTQEESDESVAVTSDLSEVIDGMMAQILRIFTLADNVANFDAVGPEDESLAQQESDYVNYVVFKENQDAFMTIFFWIFDSLLLKNGFVQCYWNRSKRATTVTHRNLLAEQLPELLEDPELEPLKQFQTEDETGTERFHIRFKRVVENKKVRIEPVPVTEFRVSADAASPDTTTEARTRMLGRERLISRSDMLDMGFKKEIVKDLPAEDPTPQTSEEIEAKDTSDERPPPMGIDKSQEKIRLRQAYIYVDFDEDGIAELREVFVANNQLLEWEETPEFADDNFANEPIDRHPFHTLTPYPLPHSFFGESVDDKVGDIQDFTTTLLRQTLTNIYHSNNPGHGVWEQAMTEDTLDDLLTSKTARVVRFKRPVSESYSPLAVPFTAKESFSMMEYFERKKTDRTGVSADSEGLSPDALKNIQISVLRDAMDVNKMKVETVARVMAETGFKSLFMHVHELLTKHQDERKLIKLRGKWVPVDVSQWKDREDMTINIGLGLGTRESNLLHLNNIWERQKEVAQDPQMRQLLLKPRDVYNTLTEMVRNANIKDPAMFFSDPGNATMPPLSDEQQQLQAQQAALQERQQQLDAQAQSIQQSKIALEKRAQDLEHRVDMLTLAEKRETREGKETLEAQRLRNDVREMRQELGRERREFNLKFEESQARIANLEADTAAKSAASGGETTTDE